MNCEDFENSVNDLAREQMMEAGIRAQALEHRDACAACAQRLAEESALSFKLRVLAADARSAEVPSMGNEILAALRERQVPMGRGTTRLRFRVMAVAATVTAVAALILVVIALGFLRSGSPKPTAQNPPAPQNPASEKVIVKAPTSLAGLKSTVSAPKNPASGNKVAGRNSKRDVNRAATLAKTTAGHDRKDVVSTGTTSVTASYSLEVATEFFPVGYGSAPNLGDGGQLLRVELPRSALVAFGIPMNVDRYNERVKADVLFGADGMAHAIRFVQ
jgi:hypothetical protein